MPLSREQPACRLPCPSRLLVKGQPRYALPRENISRNVLPITVQPDINAGVTKAKVAEYELIKKIRHDRLAKTNLVPVACEIEAKARSQ